VYDPKRKTFLVIDRDSAMTKTSDKAVIEFDFRSATNLLGYNWTALVGNEYPEMVASDKLDNAIRTDGMKLVQQYELFNLPSIGAELAFDKPEGLALKADGTIFVGYDNDFTHVTGRADNLLTKVTFQALTVDTTDKDGGIKPGSRDFYGVRQPDSIASFTAGGQTFTILANEGDSRVRPDDVNFEVTADGYYALRTVNATGAMKVVKALKDELTGAIMHVVESTVNDTTAVMAENGDEFYVTMATGFQSDTGFSSNEKRLEKCTHARTHTHTHTHIRTETAHAHIQTPAHTHRHTHTHLHTHTHAHTHTHTYTHTHIHTHSHTHTHTHSHTHTHNLTYTYIDVQAHTRTHARSHTIRDTQATPFSRYKTAHGYTHIHVFT
jgi:hypothetical protein